MPTNTHTRLVTICPKCGYDPRTVWRNLSKSLPPTPENIAIAVSDHLLICNGKHPSAYSLEPQPDPAPGT